MKVARGRLLVKPIETQETLGGGKIIVPDSARESWVQSQYEIVAVGDAPYCDDEDCEQTHVKFFDRTVHEVEERLKSGAWILCRPRATVDAGERDRYFVSMDDVIGVFE